VTEVRKELCILIWLNDNKLITNGLDIDIFDISLIATLCWTNYIVKLDEDKTTDNASIIYTFNYSLMLFDKKRLYEI
jgi:hypothetical protein